MRYFSVDRIPGDDCRPESIARRCNALMRLGKTKRCYSSARLMAIPSCPRSNLSARRSRTSNFRAVPPRWFKNARARSSRRQWAHYHPSIFMHRVSGYCRDASGARCTVSSTRLNIAGRFPEAVAASCEFPAILTDGCTMLTASLNFSSRNSRRECLVDTV